MRTDDEFFLQLRQEIAGNQAHRASFIKMKLSFIVGLLGIGAVSGDQLPLTARLLYLVPFVALIFDLYILGEDFGIKRIGRFIRSSPAASREEHIWENVLGGVRDRYTYFAGPLTTAVAIAASSVAVEVAKIDYLAFGWWLGTNVVLLVFLLLTPIFRRQTFSRFDELLKAKRLELAKDDVVPKAADSEPQNENE